MFDIGEEGASNDGVPGITVSPTMNFNDMSNGEQHIWLVEAVKKGQCRERLIVVLLTEALSAPSTCCSHMTVLCIRLDSMVFDWDT